MSKKISIIAPNRKNDVWSVPLSFVYEFRRLGFDIKIYNNLNDDVEGVTQLDPRAWTEDGIKQMLHEAQNNVFVPDIIIHFDFGLFKSSLLNKNRFPQAFWIYESGDDPQCYSYNLEKVKTGNYDLIMSPDIRTTNAYIEQGYRAVWSPHFADPLYLGEDVEPEYDAITSRHFSEPFFVELKALLGDRFTARDSFINEKDHLPFLKKGRIVVQNSKYKEISRRLFEGMLANRLVITDRLDPTTSIASLFEENKDIIYYDNAQDCFDKINFYCNNSDERLKIALSGYNKVKTQHTIQKRVEKLLQLL